MDPLVLDLPFPLRWLLVNLLIVPRRRRLSARLYRNIWTAKGSPLLLHSLDLGKRLSARLGPSYRVKVAMRYGVPSLGQAFADLRKEEIEDVIVSPQYPQYALATCESTRRAAARAAGEVHPEARLTVLAPFFKKDGFLDAYAALLADFDQAHRPEHYVFSFHGLPVRHLKTTVESGSDCHRSAHCCETLSEANRLCYRAQCLWTAREVARRVGIEEGKFSVGFQSRLGPVRWIEPHSDRLLTHLAAAGVRRVAVACPSFTADCLETLEEVGIRFRLDFSRRGGDLLLVPCLNANGPWVQALADMIEKEREDRLAGRNASEETRKPPMGEAAPQRTVSGSRSNGFTTRTPSRS
jgi:ferrochelatase